MLYYLFCHFLYMWITSVSENFLCLECFTTIFLIDDLCKFVIFFFPEALHRQSHHWLESKYFTQWMLNILLKPAKGILKENRWHCKTNSSELLVGKKKREDHCSLHNGLFGDRKGQNVDWGCEILYKEKEILLLINFLQKANFDMRWSYTQHLSKFCLSHEDLLLKPSKVRSYWKKCHILVENVTSFLKLAMI